MNQAAIKMVKVDGKDIRVTFDGRFVDVTEICDTGRNELMAATVDDETRNRAIWEAGKSFSRSKVWQRERRMAGNWLFENEVAA